MADNYSFLVTGAAGYLGSTLVPELLRLGHQVTALDNFMFKQASLAAACADPNFELVNGDARDENLLRGLLKNADFVIPLAALVGAPLCNRDPIAATTTNRDAVASLARLMGREQRLIIPTTNSGYGIGEHGQMCTEESPLRPISLYGHNKVDAEKIVLDRGNGISLRLATVFGMSPRMRLDLLVNDFVYRAVYDRFVVVFEGHFKRNYIHVRDVTNAFVHAMRNFPAMKDNAFNVGLSEANLSKIELCKRIQTHVPGFVYLEAPVGEDPDKRDYIVSNAKLEATGWRPQHSLDMGIRELIKGFRMIRNSQYGNL